jgi:preprotein translocase subunit SecE
MTIIKKAQDYVKGSLEELKKVVWPTKKQTINYSIIVVVMTLGVAIFFAILDNLFNFILERLI